MAQHQAAAPRDVGVVLAQALADLRNIRASLQQGAGGQALAALDRAEAAVALSATGYNNAGYNGATDNNNDAYTYGYNYEDEYRDNYNYDNTHNSHNSHNSLARGDTRRGGGKEVRGKVAQRELVNQSQGEGASARRASALLHASPTSDLVRKYLEARYGLGEVGSANARAVGRRADGKVCKTHAGPARVLSKTAREDPFHPLNLVSESDVAKGLLYLLSTGLLPRATDLTPALAASPSPLRTKPAATHTSSTPATQRNNNNRGDYFGSLGLGGISHVKLGELGGPQGGGGGGVVVSDWREGSPSSGGVSSSSRGVTPNAVVLGVGSNVRGSPSPGTERLGTPGGEQRGYTDLLDAFSLHEVAVRRGVTLDSTPEFKSFRRAYAARWPDIADYLSRIEEVCYEHDVPLAVIDGKALADLAEDGAVRARMGQPPPSLSELLSASLKNLDQVGYMLGGLIPPKEFEREKTEAERMDENCAATVIQAAFRGYQARKLYKSDRRRITAATTIQRWFRLKSFQRATAKRIAAARAETLRKFMELQDRFRAEWAKEVKEGNHVVVHVPSWSFEEHLRTTIPQFAIRQNAHMSRLFDLSRPHVDVVYVSPFPVSEDVEGYYSKLLQTHCRDGGGGGGAGGRNVNVATRYRVVVPENHGRFPMHFSLAKLLLYSPYALKRISLFIRGRPAYLHPSGAAGPEDLALAVKLNIPMMAAGPQVARSLSTKTATKAVFREAEVNMAPGLSVRSEDELVRSLAELVADYPTTARWIFKIEDEIHGRGHAHFDIASTRALVTLVDSITGVHPGRAMERKGLLESLASTLRRALPRKSVLACPSVYPTWAEYAMAVDSRGCIVEASPQSVIGSPSVNMLIEPDGTFHVTSTHEQVFSPAYRPAGASFPQSSVPHGALHQAARSVGAVLARRYGVVGVVGVGFIALKEEGAVRLWGADVNIRATATMASFDLFHFVSEGVFDPATGSYTVPEPPSEPVGPSTDPSLPGLSPNPGPGPMNPVSKGVAVVAGSNMKSQRRFYAMSDHVSHRDIGLLQHAAFFNRCRLEGFAFDPRERVGTVFNLMDSFAGGVVGIVCAGRSPQEAFRTLANVLDFLSRQIGLSSGEEELEGDYTLRGVRATFKYLADKLSAKK